MSSSAPAGSTSGGVGWDDRRATPNSSVRPGRSSTARRSHPRATVQAVTSTRMNRIINAPRDRVYAALDDPEAVARWRFPTGMTCEVHELDARKGGAIRISLTYDATDRAGKTHGRAG